MLLEAAEETVRAEENGSGKKVAAYTPLNRHRGREVPTWGRGARRCRAPKRKNAGTGEEQPRGSPCGWR